MFPRVFRLIFNRFYVWKISATQLDPIYLKPIRYQFREKSVSLRLLFTLNTQKMAWIGLTHNNNIDFLQSTTFHVVYKNIPAALTLHWTDGFLLKPFASPTFAFTYSFSQLKGNVTRLSTIVEILKILIQNFNQ